MSIDDTARRITIGLDAHGRPIARKQASPERLAHEADVLLRVQMPGVVRLVTHDHLTGELGLAWTGGRSLADPPAHRPAGEVLTIVRSLARTVTALHAAGVVHHRIEPTHVLVTDDGPILTGFAEATVTDDGQPADPHVDVMAVGRLIDVLLGPASVPARPEARPSALRRVPERARPRDDHRGRAAKQAAPDQTAVTLRRIARRSQDRSSPCTMEELCSALDAVVAPPTTPVVSITLDTAVRGRMRTAVGALRARRRAIAVAAVACSIVTALFVIPRFTGPGDRVAAANTPVTTTAAQVDASVVDPTSVTRVTARSAANPTTRSTAASSPAASATAATTPVTPTTTTTVAAGERIWPPPTALAIDPQQFTVRGHSLESGVVESGGVRYRLAADPQDRWLAGDWNCDTTSRLVILRLPSGAVDIFDAWPEPGRSVTSRRVAVVAGAVDLAATADGCARLAVTDSTGAVITLVAS